MAMDGVKDTKTGPVRLSKMNDLVPGYPRTMMFGAFPIMIPNNVSEVMEVLLSAHLLYQHKVSLVINKEYGKWDWAKQRESLGG